MDKITLVNRLDMIKANCEINQGQPFTKEMLKIIAETMDEAKEYIEKATMYLEKHERTVI